MGRPLHHLDLLALLAEGAWGPLRLGASRPQVLELFGPPDDPPGLGPDGAPFGAVAWAYGPVELVFEGQRLVRVSCSDARALRLAPPLGLGPEARDHLAMVDLAACEQALDAGAIGYDVLEGPEPGQVAIHSEAGGVVVFSAARARRTAVAAQLDHR